MTIQGLADPQPIRERQEMDTRGTAPDPAAVAAARAAQEANPGETVILFGSRARGDHRPNSDMDIMIVCRGSVVGADFRARRAMKEHFAQNPPRLGFDIVTLTRENFDYCRRAPNHVTGQAVRDGVILSGERLDYPHHYDDEYPASWPDVKERMLAAHRNLRAFEMNFQMLLEDQETWAGHGQQAIENSMKAWASAAEVGYKSIHDLDDVMDRLISHKEESQTLAAHQLLLLKYYTTYEDPDPEQRGAERDWLVLCAGKYKYSGTAYRMDKMEQEEFRQQIIISSHTFMNRAHELTGTTTEDLR